MLKQEVNISAIQKDLPKLMDLVIKGDEIIITKSDIPIAKITPIENETFSTKSAFLAARTMELQRAYFGEATENWFG
jgi:antitoxin (DNA-binding transcriptional repressor) of toxin-antitoxin stability system